MSKIHDFVVKHLVADVPDAMSACLDCGFVQCLNEKWETCANRLARQAGLIAMQAAASAAAVEPAAGAATSEAKDPTLPCPAHR